MSTLEDLNSGPGGMVGFISSLSRRFRPVSRRNVLLGATVAATALATKPKEYALRPVAAYATICGPGNTASSGWTVFCCTINKGVNACPPGSFAAGWWKAADSSWCGRGYRYIVDCNASCSRCTTGCSDGICDSRCWSCSCGSGSTATCDQRRVCCNAFRYGQCNTQVRCSGGVHCRVVSCVPPYRWTNCTTTTLVDNRTSEHSAPCLPRWGPIEQRYVGMGAQGSFLKASTGPTRNIGDARGGVYGLYQGGGIYWNRLTGAQPVSKLATTAWSSVGGLRGTLGYPVNAAGPGSRAGGWIQRFDRGAVAGASSTVAFPVYEPSWTAWWMNGREGGALGYPTHGRTAAADGSWVQVFQGGAVADSPNTDTIVVHGLMYTGWARLGRESGVLRYPLTSAAAYARGYNQVFQGGELWSLGGGDTRLLYGKVLTTWRGTGGPVGGYGYPLTDTTPTGDGRLTCQFEGGTITA